ncbi:MAG: DEAD/DEAH box helicase [Selenomonas ruminantium]|uniref:DEAD/DEAH box helicase n=1 Tax=Selenomonas ruminantium TaxID=971 RepID=A0A927WM41_SELRU|nr:DEAD/DEAH box helicase [Selenomonas ruminantium]
MLPSILAKQLQQGIRDYIETTFPMTNEPFAGSLSSMFDEHDAVYHAPYVAVKLPFRTAEAMPDCFEGVDLPFLPYVHQQKAYERLTGEGGRSTLIATGTGSGKTECFLNPILEYCYQHQGEPGIKALIIYPMNALATDQASRIAKAIYQSPKLHNGNEPIISVGMYVGGGKGKGSTMMMEPDKDANILGVITDHDTMINQPPDILLTNYKMLDYLLVRPKDASLWQDNTNPETLKFIVVDEFHTFDGAQGTDLACLLRRLKARLNILPGYLCCVGTSATMGDKNSDEQIRNYAADVFGEPFDSEVVITEDRLSPEEFFDGVERNYLSMPTAEQVEELNHFVDADDEQDYMQLAAAAWLPELNLKFTGNEESIANERISLGMALKQHSFFQDVLSLMRGNYFQCQGLYQELLRRYPVMESWKDKEAGFNSLFALVSYARGGSAQHLRPFLFVQVQLWMRELRRLLGRVSAEHVDYMLAPDLNEGQRKAYLPIVNCRDCGATGWAGVMDEGHHATVKNLETFYNLFFNVSDKIALMYPGHKGHEDKDLRPAKLCPNCHHVSFDENETNCPDDNGEYIDVLIPSIKTSGSKEHRQYVCPFCGSRRGISLMGLRSTTEISASLSQIMASKFNDDKKTLTFSDSVQDAAHRAGFFNSRTWRFGLRGAIQRYVKDGGVGQSLEQFASGFLAYWEKKMSREEFVSFFIPPNLKWTKGFKALTENRVFGTDKAAMDLLRDIRRRISYEIMLEYGVTSRIGRTLTKAGCSCLTFERSEIDQLADKVQERVINELGVMSYASPFDFQRMVYGYLDIMRQQGAFYDGVFNKYCQEDGRPYLISNDYYKWLPGVKSGRNTPRFICKLEGRGKKPYYFDSIGDYKYTAWIENCVEETEFTRADLSKDVSEIILTEALKLDMVREMPAKDNSLKIFGLNKEHVFVSDHVITVKCDDCGSEAECSEEFSDMMQGAICSRRNCGGIMQQTEDSELGYYGVLYSSGDLVRIHAEEHTGLLEREEREKVENDFKRSPKDGRQEWDPNILSCTPTLEMGIDIGDLSSVVLCSMPPGQAQFLQRAGRAGRTDGNSLVLAISGTRPHDLYFYTEPLEMMQGNVKAPHIFLKASAVLQRQFMAFCMDNWIKSGVEESAIPKTLGNALDNVKHKRDGSFPYNYLNFVQKKLSSLFTMFISMFKELDEQAIKELKEFAQGNGLEKSPLQIRVIHSFEEINKQIESIDENIKALKILQKEYESKPQDSSYEEDIKELQRERTALLNVKRELRKKDIFNFLSDEGLLPNYAFPEEGITLKAVLFRREDEDTEKPQKKPKYSNSVYEYKRAASVAISEFAPNNSFYAGGHQFTIDQVDINTSKPDLWRLCPNCAHAEQELTIKNKAACPHCGSPMWADDGQVREMLRVNMVYSNMDMDKSIIDDGSENREIKFYTKQLLVDVDEEHDIEKAYSMNNDDFPFGYDFVKKATLREINFGEADVSKAEELTVNGVSEARKGFMVCKFCGRIKDSEGKIKHAPYCKTRKNSALQKEAEEECIFLYREFSTEVLRLLIPETTSVGTRVKTESFTAAFMLGMKEYFGGVDHLRASICEVPVKDGEYRKQYLVIYDSVPGGTGYLKQLIQHDDALTDIFAKALHVLETCRCKEDEKKDGCYHCLYAYRQSKNIGEISRSVAIQLLNSILSGKDNIESIKCLGDIKTNYLFDSELEQQFIVALGKMGNDKRLVDMQQALVNDKQGYIMNITTKDKDGQETKAVSWEIEPQVSLDSQQGVSVRCKPDFVLWPNFDTKDGQHLPVAVFTDGFLYHKDKVADDTLKREAIHRSGNFRVWSLSYKDVQDVFHAQDDFATNTLDAGNMPLGNKMYEPLVKQSGALSIRPAKTKSLELLMEYLTLPNAEREFQGQAKAYAMSLLEPSRKGSAIDFNSWSKKIEAVGEDSHFHELGFSFGKTMFGSWRPRSVESDFTCLAGLDFVKYGKSPEQHVVVAAILEDRVDWRSEKYELEWNGFWHFNNVMQFMKDFIAVSELGLSDKTYLALPLPAIEVTEKTAENDTPDDGWSAVIEKLSEFADETEMALVESLRNKHICVPDVIADDLMDNGKVLDAVELAWSANKIAFVLSECEEAKENIAKAGWTIFDEHTENVEALFTEGM